MCWVLRIQRHGYYASKKKPKSKHTLVDKFLLVKIKQSFEKSKAFTAVHAGIVIYVKMAGCAERNALLG